jgi:hypothetical protein
MKRNDLPNGMLVKTVTTTLQAEVQHAAVNPKDSASQKIW